LIEELAAEQIERGIAVCRFNQRGGFSKGLYDGGKQERGLANQYRNWADSARNWPRTNALLRQIADGWDRDAARADSEAELDQLRDS
jgi:alpha/beta superfamily hydrolase